MRKSVCVLAVLLLMIFLTACDSEEQKKQNEVWQAKASENAIAHIQKKYGVNAEVISAKVDREYGIFGSTPLPDIFVDMKYKDMKFQTYITGQNTSTDGVDSYQAQEIETALREFLEKNISGVDHVTMTDKHGSELIFEKPLYSVYYDGNNLREVMQSALNGFTAYYVKTDFSDQNDFLFLDAYHHGDNAIFCKFVSCRSKDAFNIKNKIGGLQEPVYCDNFRMLDAGRGDYCAYDLHEFEKLKYCIIKTQDSTDKNISVHFKKTSVPDVSVFGGYGASSDTKAASDAYFLSADAEVHIVVYFPLSDISDYDDRIYYMQNRTRIGRIRHSHQWQNEDDISAGPVCVVGDYAYETFNIGPESGDITFMYLSDPD